MSLGVYNTIEIAEIRTQVNKYKPPQAYPFYIPKLVPFKNGNTQADPSIPLNTSNLANKDKGKVKVDKFSSYGIMYITLPKHIAVSYPVKYIPVGAKFLVSFIGGDITKPLIVGRYQVDAEP